MSGLDVDALLRRAIERSADAVGLAIRIVRSSSTRWASATFSGARHELQVTGDCCAAFEAWLAALAEADLPVRDHLVADLKIIAVHRDATATAVIEALTVEER